MRKMITGAMLFALSTVTISSTTHAAEICWRTDEMNAAKVRNLQSELMVAALECNRGGYGSSQLYDRFVNANRSALVGFNDSIKLYFVRAYGDLEGRRAYDHFTTALANRQANSAATTEGFCRSADTAMRLALDSRPAELIAIASDLEERPFGVGITCDEARDLGSQRSPARPSVALANPEPAYAPEPPAYPPEPAYAPDPRDADPYAPRAEDNANAPRPEPARYDPQDAPPLPAAPLSAALPASAPVIPAAVPVVAAVAVPKSLPAPALVKVAAPASARASPAEALAAAVQALQAATEALKASAAAAPAVADAPVDAAPVIHERAAPAHRL